MRVPAWPDAPTSATFMDVSFAIEWTLHAPARRARKAHDGSSRLSASNMRSPAQGDAVRDGGRTAALTRAITSARLSAPNAATTPQPVRRPSSDLASGLGPEPALGSIIYIMRIKGGFFPGRSARNGRQAADFAVRAPTLVPVQDCPPEPPARPLCSWDWSTYTPSALRRASPNVNMRWRWIEILPPPMPLSDLERFASVTPKKQRCTLA